MKKQDFLSELQNALEFENIKFSEETDLKKIDGFDSLHVMMTIAFVDEKFKKKITAKQLFTISTVRSLMEVIGLDNFEE